MIIRHSIDTRGHGASPESKILFLIVGAYSIWMLSLPCFPSTDGPVHLYYAHILSTLLFHHNLTYQHYFHVRHLIPPYCLYYYLLIVLSEIVPMLLADRLVICLYIVSFAYGFRYLARAIGPSADRTTLLSTLLILNWPLGMGFVSFCLSLSLSFWALGLWLRISETKEIARRGLFIILVMLGMLAHPIPMAVLLCVTGLLVTTRLFQQRRVNASPATLVPELANVLTLTLACSALAYVRLFTTAHPFRQGESLSRADSLSGFANRFSLYSRQHALSFLYGRSTDLLVYRFGLVIILVFPMAAALVQRRRNSRSGVWTIGDNLFVLGVMLLVSITFIPPRLNDCYYFADRLTIYVWVAFLLAASGWSPRMTESFALPEVFSFGGQVPLFGSRLGTTSFMVFILVVTGCMLHAADRLLRPAANSIASLKSTVLGEDHVGFIMEDDRQRIGEVHESVSWDPYYWALVNAFRQSNAILANAPWMDESIIPVAPSAALPEMTIRSLQEPVPALLKHRLLTSPTDYRATFSRVQFFFFNTFDRPRMLHNPLLDVQSDATVGWSCSTGSWYEFCFAPANSNRDQQTFRRKANALPRVSILQPSMHTTY